MLLSLDHQQRLNLIALMGTQRGTVAEMRMFWSLQDKLDLDQEERAVIEYRVATSNGIEQPSWNPEKSLPLREFEVSEAEAARLRRVIEGWPHFLTAVDRKWILPLLDQLPEAVSAVPASLARAM
jgi:hypothetical protein